jgi:hypothetical protein
MAATLSLSPVNQDRYQVDSLRALVQWLRYYLALTPYSTLWRKVGAGVECYDRWPDLLQVDSVTGKKTGHLVKPVLVLGHAGEELSAKTVVAVADGGPNAPNQRTSYYASYLRLRVLVEAYTDEYTGTTPALLDLIGAVRTISEKHYSDLSQAGILWLDTKTEEPSRDETANWWRATATITIEVCVLGSKV